MTQTHNIASYIDGPNLPELIQNINGIPGSLVQNPRPDMPGVFVVADIVSIDVLEHSSGLFAVVVLLSLRPSLSEEREQTAMVMASPVGEEKLLDLLGEVRE